jgi:S-adenosylmethionine/arginine decarboxylase-like enzyme
MLNLIKDIGMEVLDGPYTVYLDDPGNRGLTGVCIIKTSHITCQVWDEPMPGLVQLDIYTCGKMEIEDVLPAIRIFKPSKIEYKFIDREFNLKLLSEGFIE